MQSTVMLIMELKSRMDLHTAEPDPQFNIALDDLMQIDATAFNDLHMAIHKAQRALTKASALRAATETKDLYKELVSGGEG